MVMDFENYKQLLVDNRRLIAWIVNRYSYLGPADIDDRIQDVWCTLLNLHKTKPPRTDQNPRAYISAVAKRVCRNSYTGGRRTQKPTPETVSIETFHEAGKEFAEDTYVTPGRDWTTECKEFPYLPATKTCRAAVLRMQNLTYEEIGNIIGSSKTDAYIMVQRGQETLRKLIDKVRQNGAETERLKRQRAWRDGYRKAQRRRRE